MEFTQPWNWLREFLLVFLPLLVAMDPLTIVPFLVPFLAKVPVQRQARVINTALLTGLAVGILFLALGRGIFLVLGIKVSDFLIAGGLILLVLSLRELLSSTESAPPESNELMAVVPVGTPLLVGPATISMLILLSGLYNIWTVIAAFVANIIIAWVVFSQSQRIVKFLGRGGLQAFAKIAYLLLAAIAIQLIRQGLAETLPGLMGG